MQDLDTEGTQHEHQEGNMHYITHMWHMREAKREGWVGLMEIIKA